MSEAIEKVLYANPEATVAEVPGAHAWTNRLMGRPVEMDHDKPFIPQVLDLLEDDGRLFSSCSWDPYEEGYDDGPGDLDDSWYCVDPISTGQFRGTVVEASFVFDRLGAVLVHTSYDGGGDLDGLVELLKEEWHPPATQDVRDRKVAEAIRQEWKRLSPEARKVLLTELSA